jgi:hypothetical protein
MTRLVNIVRRPPRGSRPAHACTHVLYEVVLNDARGRIRARVGSPEEFGLRLAGW